MRVAQETRQLLISEYHSTKVLTNYKGEKVILMDEEPGRGTKWIRCTHFTRIRVQSTPLATWADATWPTASGKLLQLIRPAQIGGCYKINALWFFFSEFYLQSDQEERGRDPQAIIFLNIQTLRIQEQLRSSSKMQKTRDSQVQLKILDRFFFCTKDTTRSHEGFQIRKN